MGYNKTLKIMFQKKEHLEYSSVLFLYINFNLYIKFQIKNQLIHLNYFSFTDSKVSPIFTMMFSLFAP